ncbi:MAG: hypothetical protein ACI4GX_08550 [Ruminococcus sp.]
MNKINKFFNFIWKLQKLIMKIKIKIDNFQTNFVYKILKKFLGISAILTFILTIMFACFYSINLATIFASIFLSLILIDSYLFSTVKAFFSPFTSVRYFLLVSVIFNGVFVLIMYAHSGIEYSVAICLFAIIFFCISLLSNTKIAKTANAIIELSLGVGGIALKMLLSSFYENKFAGDITQALGQSVGDIANLTLENLLSGMIDTYLYPLLMINGIALLICTIHSYWIDKYHNGKEITWDKNLISEYIK